MPPKTAPKKRGPKPGTPRAPHRADCPCDFCERARKTNGQGPQQTKVGVWLDNELAAWVKQQGGAPFLRQLVREARELADR